MDAYHDNLFSARERVYCQKVIMFEKIVECTEAIRQANEALQHFLQIYLRATGFDQQFLSECGIAELEEEATKQ